MAKKNPFEEVMKQRSFAELIDIVKKKRNDYQPEAVEAAEAELKLRKEKGEKWEAPEPPVHQKKLSAQEKAIMPLPALRKLFVFFIPTISTFSAARRLQEEGYLQQSRELEKWFFFGFLFYLGLLIALFVFAMIADN